MSSEARAIYQDVLNKLTEAIMDHDVDLWVSYMHVPHFMNTCDGRLAHETERDVRIGLTDYHMALRKLKVTRMVRTCETARQSRKDTIVGYHVTRMFAGDGTAYPGYPVRWVLHKVKGVWKVAKSDSALSAKDWGQIPHNTLSQFDEIGGDTTKVRRMQLQLSLDQNDHVFLSGDMAGLLNNICLPFVVDARSGRRIFHTAEEMEADFALYQKELSIHGVTEISRVVRDILEQTDDTTRCTYRAHVLSGTNYVVPPWDGEMTFKRIENHWRLSGISQAIGHLNWNTHEGASAHQNSAPDTETQNNRNDGEYK